MESKSLEENTDQGQSRYNNLEENRKKRERNCYSKRKNIRTATTASKNNILKAYLFGFVI